MSRTASVEVYRGGNLGGLRGIGGGGRIADATMERVCRGRIAPTYWSLPPSRPGFLARLPKVIFRNLLFHKGLGVLANAIDRFEVPS